MNVVQNGSLLQNLCAPETLLKVALAAHSQVECQFFWLFIVAAGARSSMVGCVSSVLVAFASGALH